MIEVLGRVPDQRSALGRRPVLGGDVNAGIVCHAVRGPRRYAISQWWRDQGQEVSEALGFSRQRTPRQFTLHQVFSGTDREAFEG